MSVAAGAAPCAPTDAGTAATANLAVMGEAHQIGPIRPEQATAAAHTLADAFRDDPLLLILARDQEARRRVAPWLMGRLVALGMRWGHVEGNEDASAAAVWLPPGQTTVSASRMLRVGMGAMPFKAGLGATKRFVAAMSATERLHESVEGPHWYLVAVGTRPARQGQGLGGALVEAGTARANDPGVPCYLETATDENVAFYSRRGFEVIGEVDVEGFSVRGMVRPPR